MFEPQPQQSGGATPANPAQPTATPVTAAPARPVPPVPMPAPKPAPAPVRPKADDIFAGTEPVTAPARPIQVAPAVPTDMTSRSGYGWIALGLFVLVALIGGGIWLTLRSSGQPMTAETSADDAITSGSIPSDGTPLDTATEGGVEAGADEQAQGALQGDVSAPLAETDTDRDGLTDADEVSFGTDNQKPDTDADGLSDSAEIRVYKTNPLNPDSDGDSYLDGAEVRAGYDPMGLGRLNDIESALQNAE